MGRARQTVRIVKSTSTSSIKTKAKVNKPTQQNTKKGNPNHCPVCGKFV